MGLPKQSATAVIAVLQMPPPINGLSTVNAAMMEELRRAGSVPVLADIAPPPGASRVRLIMLRTARVARSLVVMRSAAHAGATTLYFSPDSTAGLFLNLVMLAVARTLELRVVYHHHNSSYVDSFSPLMERAIKLGPIGSIHIVLCDSVGMALRDRYRAVWEQRGHRHIVLSNVFLLPAPPVSPALAPAPTLTIGHLSNLSVAKGAIRFLCVFESLVEAGTDISAIIAGPIQDEEVRVAITRIADRYPGRFTWAGPIYGEAKEAFYRTIDVFLFPTDYVNEVQPLVLFEALAQGAAVLTTDRGCIACDMADAPGAVFELASFQDKATAWLRELAGSSERRTVLRAQAVAAFVRAREQALRSLPFAISAITGS